MFITRSKYEQYFFKFFVFILTVLVVSTVIQIRSNESMKTVFKDDSHRHKRSIFDSRHQKVVVGNELTITPSQSQCTYWNCIDSYKCLDDGKGRMSVYVYDVQKYVDSEHHDLLPESSNEFVHLLWAIVHSKYFVDDPAKACILLPSIDLLNRENFSGRNASKVLSSLPHWNNGTNHLLFNMVPGAPPRYFSFLDFPRGNAMVTGSGFTQRSYRRTFDITVPLFNPHQHDHDFVRVSPLRNIFIIAAQKTFYRSIFNQIKGMADALPEVVVLKQCSGAGMENQTCDTRGMVHSYPAVLTKSQFCLITKEQQLASIYLHDILRAGCVPVICMDTYVLPFSEVLDWRRAAVFINEYRLDKLVEILRSILADGHVYQQLQEQGNFYYERYFESMAKIALTTLDIINSRVLPSLAPLYEHWNRPLVPSAPPNPFFVPLVPSQKQGYTAVILTYDRFELMKLVVANIANSKHVAKILVIWNNPKTQPPNESHWPAISVPLKVIRSKHNWLSNRFYPYEEVDTDCVLTIDDDITMVPASELDFGYRVWTENADRLVGFPPRYHSSNGSHIKYDSEWMSNISMVLTGVAFYHKYYHYLFTSSLPGNIKDWVDEHMNCEDIAMNYLIANVTGKAPVKLLPRKKFKASSGGISSVMTKHLVARNVCMKKFTDAFGCTPLRTVEFRADPVLYKQEGYSDDMRMYKIEGEL